MFFKCVKCGKRFFLPGKRLACYRQHCLDEAVAKDALDRHEREQDRIFNAEARQHKTELASRRQTAYRPPSRTQSNNYGEHDMPKADPLLFDNYRTHDQQNNDTQCRTSVADHVSSSNDSCSGGGDD